MNKRKEIESFLGEDFYKTEINDKNIQEIEKKIQGSKKFCNKGNNYSINYNSCCFLSFKVRNK